MENIKVALCVIARLENKYIKEYVKYYKSIGFDKIFIYDNNRPMDNEKIADEISAYVDTGLVDVIDWPVFEGDAQLPAYQDCFDKHKNEYDWIAFFDSDEYLSSDTENFNVKDFLSNSIYNDWGGVAIGQIVYDDNDVIINYSKSRLTTYTRPAIVECPLYVKTIVKCKDNSVDFTSDKSIGYHLPFMLDKSICDIDGIVIGSQYIYNYTKDLSVFLKHITTGSIDDYLNIKRKRRWPDKRKNPDFDLNYFAQYNSVNQEKINYYIENEYK